MSEKTLTESKKSGDQQRAQYRKGQVGTDFSEALSSQHQVNGNSEQEGHPVSQKEDLDDYPQNISTMVGLIE